MTFSQLFRSFDFAFRYGKKETMKSWSNTSLIGRLDLNKYHALYIAPNILRVTEIDFIRYENCIET